jgi:hypothetical protein
MANWTTDLISAVCILADGWHEVQPGTFFLDVDQGFVDAAGDRVVPGGPWFHFTEKVSGITYAQPWSQVLALRNEPA